MKRTLVTLAVLGAFGGAASAQTNITLYGIADAGFGIADTDTPGSDSTTMVYTSVQSSSRFGIRGSEDIGSGLKVTFNLESGVDIDDGEAGDPFWARRAVVGLAGGFGEVRLGRDYTPGYSAIGTTDVMGLGLFGNWLNFGGNGGITSRKSNGVHFTSPVWSGFTLRAMYATGEADDVSRPSGDGDMYGVSGVYASGPLTVQAYFQSSESANAAGNNTVDRDEYGIGGQYRFGAFRVALNYGKVDRELPAGGDVEHDAIGLGLGAKIGTGELLFNYIQQELDSAGKPEAKSFGIAYVYPLSKRTNLYATYGQLKNDDGADFALRAAGFGVGGGVANTEPKAFALGIRHRF